MLQARLNPGERKIPKAVPVRRAEIFNQQGGQVSKQPPPSALPEETNSTQTGIV
jgi:hypothetical protein